MFFSVSLSLLLLLLLFYFVLMIFIFYMFHLFLLYIFCFWRQGSSVSPWLSWNSLYRPSWPQTHRVPPLPGPQFLILMLIHFNDNVVTPEVALINHLFQGLESWFLLRQGLASVSWGAGAGHHSGSWSVTLVDSVKCLCHVCALKLKSPQSASDLLTISLMGGQCGPPPGWGPFCFTLQACTAVHLSLQA